MQEKSVTLEKYEVGGVAATTSATSHLDVYSLYGATLFIGPGKRATGSIDYVNITGEPNDIVVSCTLSGFDVPASHLRLGKTRVFFPAAALRQINDLLEFDEIEDDQYLWGNADMYDFYFEVAKKGLYYTSPVTRTKSLSILS